MPGGQLNEMHCIIFCFFCTFSGSGDLETVEEVSLYGELEKWVPMSPQRTQNIVVTGDNVYVSLTGAVQEQVYFHLMTLH